MVGLHFSTGSLLPFTEFSARLVRGVGLIDAEFLAEEQVAQTYDLEKRIISWLPVRSFRGLGVASDVVRAPQSLANNLRTSRGRAHAHECSNPAELAVDLV